MIEVLLAVTVQVDHVLYALDLGEVGDEMLNLHCLGAELLYQASSTLRMLSPQCRFKSKPAILVRDIP